MEIPAGPTDFHKHMSITFLRIVACTSAIVPAVQCTSDTWVSSYMCNRDRTMWSIL